MENSLMRSSRQCAAPVAVPVELWSLLLFCFKRVVLVSDRHYLCNKYTLFITFGYLWPLYVRMCEINDPGAHMWWVLSFSCKIGCDSRLPSGDRLKLLEWSMMNLRSSDCVVGILGELDVESKDVHHRRRQWVYIDEGIIRTSRGKAYYKSSYLACQQSVFFTPARYMVVKITCSCFEVVLWTIKHTIFYPGSSPSLEVIALRARAWYWRWTVVTMGMSIALEKFNKWKGGMFLCLLPEGWEYFYRLGGGRITMHLSYLHHG
jgi:hypothetical protein